MDNVEREKFIWRQLLTTTHTTEEAVEEIVRVWDENVLEAKIDAYDEAATDITKTLQDCIPDKSRTVEEARLKGAWTDAASIALNHIGGKPKKRIT